jgi:hypothetical protein
MKAKLFLFYLRIRKLLPAIALLCLAVTIYNQFLDYRTQLAIADTSPWIVEEILTGDRFIASRSGKQVEVKLCGVTAGNESRDYLHSLLNKGDLVIDTVRKDDGITVAEVFVQLKPDYEREIHLNTEMVMGGMATLDNPDICPSAEYLKMAEINKK